MKFENLEKQNNPEIVETAKQGENKLELKKKIERLARNAVVWGMVSIAGILAAKGFKEESDYKHYRENINQEEIIKSNELKTKLIKKIGEKEIVKIENGDKEAFLNHQEQRMPPKIENFEEIGLDSPVLEKIWNENGKYPQNWLNGEVKSINYSKRGREMSDYGEKFKKQIEKGHWNPYSEQIILTINEKEQDYLSKRDLADSLDFTISHEFAHSNDWETDNDLTLGERMELLTKIIKRIESEKPFRSIVAETFNEKSYHEKIEIRDKQKEKSIKAKEYWAEICQYYFNMPNWLQQEYPEDFSLVDKYVKKNDSNFDPFIAKEKRASILRQKYGLSDAEKTFGLNK